MKKNSYAGKFIVFEGIDGSGKTTQARLMGERFAKEGINALCTREPTDENIFGKLVRSIYTCQSLKESLPDELVRCLQGEEYHFLRDMRDDAPMRQLRHFEDIADQIRKGCYDRLPMLLQLGMIFDRYYHRIRTELPKLREGIHVVSDRDFFSTLAYSAANDISWQTLLDAHEDILGNDFIVPDLLLIIDVPVHVGIERTLVKQGGRRDYFDTKERLTKIRERYLELSRDPEMNTYMSIAVVSGGGTFHDLHEKIWAGIAPVINPR